MKTISEERKEVSRACMVVAVRHALLTAMTHTASTFADIARKSSRSEKSVRRSIMGTGTLDLNTISDLFLAAGCEPDFSLVRLPEPPVGTDE